MADEHTADWLQWRANRMGFEMPELDAPSHTPLSDQPDPDDIDYDAWFDARLENRSPA